jgi:hypothetical protein
MDLVEIAKLNGKGMVIENTDKLYNERPALNGSLTGETNVWEITEFQMRSGYTNEVPLSILDEMSYRHNMPSYKLE